MKKIDKRVWWSLPIILGVYLIYRQFSKVKPTVIDDSEIANGGSYKPGTGSIATNSSSSYPLKNGSKDAGSPKNPTGLVVEVQRLINAYGGYKPKIGTYVSLPLKLTEDGVYGNNTEWAIEQYLGKKTIDNRQDIFNLEKKMIEKQQQNNSIF
jgi:hypothetical protein